MRRSALTEDIVERLTKLYAQLGTATKNYDAEVVREAIEALSVTDERLRVALDNDEVDCRIEAIREAIQ